MSFEDQNPNETIYEDQAVGSAGQATTAKLRVEIQGVTLADDVLTLNFTDSVSGTFDTTTGKATIPITPGAQQANQNDLVGRLSSGVGALENFQINDDLPNEASPQATDCLLAQRASDDALIAIDIGNLPTGGGGEANLGANVGTGSGV